MSYTLQVFGTEFYPIRGGDPTHEPSMTLLKGTSGTGKGTRMRQLLSFYQSIYEHWPIYTDVRGQKMEVGTYIERINTIFIGKKVISNKSGLESWSSLDYINSKTLKTEETQEILKECAKMFHIVAEGEPMICSHRYRAKHLYEYMGIRKLMTRYYVYDNKDEYLARIVERSGTPPTRDGGWARNDMYLPQYTKDMEEVTQVPIKHDIKLLSHTEEHTQFGIEFLYFHGLSAHKVMFLAHAKANDVRRSVNPSIPSQLSLI